VASIHGSDLRTLPIGGRASAHRAADAERTPRRHGAQPSSRRPGRAWLTIRVRGGRCRGGGLRPGRRTLITSVADFGKQATRALVATQDRRAGPAWRFTIRRRVIWTPHDSVGPSGHLRDGFWSGAPPRWQFRSSRTL